MPSVTAYSAYETLAFFQSVAKYGADVSALQEISTTLAQSEFIRRSNDNNVERLSVEALKGLYDEVIGAEKSSNGIQVNGGGSDGERSPKRRKLSTSPQPERNNQQLVQDLVDRLYVRYKETMVNEIKSEEESYVRLQIEIKNLEREIEAQNDASKNTDVNGQTEQSRRVEGKAQHGGLRVDGVTATPPPPKHDVSIPETRNMSHLPGQPSPHPTPVLPSQPIQTHRAPVATSGTSTPQPPGQQGRSSQPSPVGAQHSPGSFNRTLPPPSPGRPNYGPIQAQPGFAMGSPAPPVQMLSHAPNLPSRPTLPRQGSGQDRRSPIPAQGQSPYSPYPPYSSQQWHPQMGVQHYQPHPNYVPPQYYPQPIPGRHPQTPHQQPFQPYSYSAPLNQVPPHGWQGAFAGQPAPASAMTTPVSRLSSRISAFRSGASTPWSSKKKRESGMMRAQSPKRPQRETSPLSDNESPISQDVSRDKSKSLGKAAKKAEDATPVQPVTKPRRGRPPSKTPSAIGPSRSQSNASYASDTANEKLGLRRGPKIKAEQPSTPLPPPSDSEQQQRSSGRRGRPRNTTMTSVPEALKPNTTTKRERETLSPSPLMSEPVTASGSKLSTIQVPHDPALLVVSKNFAKTSQLLLNDITSHKLAGIFAKPLSERDAPGYKDLVLRPQDLKSIKAAVSKGSRAALAAIETHENEDEGGATPTLKTSIGENTVPRRDPGPIGNGFYLVRKTEDLMPPKGIVNSSQLEMELVRMFANAVMFNPLPSSERGFGRRLRIRRHGGDVDHERARDDNEEEQSEREASTSEEGSSTVGGAGWDEGGIIADAREMFEDVIATVGKWRSLEEERMTAGNPDASTSARTSFATPSVPHTGTADGGRHSSVSHSVSSHVDGPDEEDREATATPIPSTTGRKRRRIADH